MITIVCSSSDGLDTRIGVGSFCDIVGRVIPTRYNYSVAPGPFRYVQQIVRPFQHKIN